MAIRSHADDVPEKKMSRPTMMWSGLVWGERGTEM